MWKWLGLVAVTMVAAMTLGCSDDQGDMHAVQQILQPSKPKEVTEDKTSPDKIKALLLRPTGWKAEWSLPGWQNKAASELTFEARGEKVVVRIQTPPAASCERDVTITSDVVKYDGCQDPEITLRFDPSDQDYPFKGKSPKGMEYALKAK
jgi:hypothetical protein